MLSTRKRKDVTSAEIQVQVCIFAFDLIYLNGQALIEEPLSKRHELLHANFNEVEGEFKVKGCFDLSSLRLAKFLIILKIFKSFWMNRLKEIVKG